MKLQIVASGIALLSGLPTGVAAQSSTSPSPSTPAAEGTTAQRADRSAADAYYRFVMGRHYESAGDIDRAIQGYREAARLEPASAEVRGELAGLYARQGRLEDAMTEARRALAIDGANREAHRVLGTLLASLLEETAPREQRAKQLVAAIHLLELA